MIQAPLEPGPPPNRICFPRDPYVDQSSSGEYSEQATAATKHSVGQLNHPGIWNCYRALCQNAPHRFCFVTRAEPISVHDERSGRRSAHARFTMNEDLT